MTRPRLFVHLGLHKTGTTSIQRYMSDQTYHLSTVGVLYPTSARHPLASTQHALLAAAFNSAVPFEGAFALGVPVDAGLIVNALRHEIELSGLRTIVVSSEELSRFPHESILALAAEFDDFEIVPVAFVRNFPGLFDKLYGSTIQYSNYFGSPSRDLARTDIARSFESWASIAADGKIRVFDYDTSPSGDSVTDFLGVIGLDPAALPSAKNMSRLNVSLPPVHVALIRELRAQHVDEVHITGLLTQLASIRFGEQQTTLPAALREELAATYDEQMTILRSSPFVVGLDPTRAAASPQDPPVLIETLTDVIFAIGRGLALTD